MYWVSIECIDSWSVSLRDSQLYKKKLSMIVNFKNVIMKSISCRTNMKDIGVSLEQPAHTPALSSNDCTKMSGLRHCESLIDSLNLPVGSLQWWVCLIDPTFLIYSLKRNNELY